MTQCGRARQMRLRRFNSTEVQPYLLIDAAGQEVIVRLQSLCEVTNFGRIAIAIGIAMTDLTSETDPRTSVGCSVGGPDADVLPLGREGLLAGSDQIPS